MHYTYHINLDERGEFYADVRGENGRTVYDIRGHSIFEDGFMCHTADIRGLSVYLLDLGVLRDSDRIEQG